jgi:3-hydroxyisobutyrate dehydrogenase-like beta-hydroxyacid dehydrogenase
MPDSLVSRAEPLLMLMGKRAIRCGAQGVGLSANLGNIYLLAINYEYHGGSYELEHEIGT